MASPGSGRWNTAGTWLARSSASCWHGASTAFGFPPKLMAAERKTARTYGKSDAIDALAIARAAIREPDLPVGRLDGPEREIALLVEYRDQLVGDLTRIVRRMRWLLHDLDPALDPPSRSLGHVCNIDRLSRRLAKL